jgi:predicted lysophospholipase L1 biosynthesis ABC-type transport system permease subunit
MKSLNDLTVAVGQVQLTLNHLAEKVQDLKDDNKALGERVQKVENKLLVASTILAVLLAVASVVGSVAAYVGNKAIDFGMDMAKDRFKAEAPASPQPPPQLPAKRQ